jgi:hypothetical protein
VGSLQELLRRLDDPEQAAKLPGTGLLNLGVAAVKMMQPQKKQDEEIELDILDIINKTDLPEERKRELLAAELGQLETRRRDLYSALEGEKNG